MRETRKKGQIKAEGWMSGGWIRRALLYLKFPVYIYIMMYHAETVPPFLKVI
jgi:hypothetical protein